jgi:hypothetical protein
MVELYRCSALAQSMAGRPSSTGGLHIASISRGISAGNFHYRSFFLVVDGIRATAAFQLGPESVQEARDFVTALEVRPVRRLLSLLHGVLCGCPPCVASENVITRGNDREHAGRGENADHSFIARREPSTFCLGDVRLLHLARQDEGVRVV